MVRCICGMKTFSAAKPCAIRMAPVCLRCTQHSLGAASRGTICWRSPADDLRDCGWGWFLVMTKTSCHGKMHCPNALFFLSSPLTGAHGCYKLLPLGLIAKRVPEQFRSCFPHRARLFGTRLGHRLPFSKSNSISKHLFFHSRRQNVVPI